MFNVVFFLHGVFFLLDLGLWLGVYAAGVAAGKKI